MTDKTRELPAIRCGSCEHFGRVLGATVCIYWNTGRNKTDPICDKFKEDK